MKYSATLFRVGPNSLGVVVPKKVLNAIDLKKGDYLLVSVEKAE